MVSGTIDIGVNNSNLCATQHGGESRAGRSAEVEIAGNERLGCDAAAGTDHFCAKSFVAVIAFFDGDKLVHIAAGHGGDGETNFIFGGRRAANFGRDESSANECEDQDQKPIHYHNAMSRNVFYEWARSAKRDTSPKCIGRLAMTPI